MFHTTIYLSIVFICICKKPSYAVFIEIRNSENGDNHRKGTFSLCINHGYSYQYLVIGEWILTIFTINVMNRRLSMDRIDSYILYVV